MAELTNIPQHVVIIPDGNRRWAKKHGLPPSDGHAEGVKNLQELIESIYKLGVSCFSFWAASDSNLLKRSTDEVEALETLLEVNFTNILDDTSFLDKQVQINVIGRWETLIKNHAAIDSIKKAIDSTKHRNKYKLNLFLAYDGVTDMVMAVERIAGKKLKNPEMQVTREVIKANLMTHGLPPVDLLIRTGGEPHLSAGFLMWDLAEAQLYFSEKLWPEFRVDDLKEALREYAGRQRRFGK